jgi:hypothetical protein
MNRDAILVVGTGRCGSSAMAGVLQILGADLGSDLKAGDGSNPKGYFENTRVTDLNKELLFEMGIDWYVSPIEDVWPILPSRDRIARIRACLKKAFGSMSPIVIKDPRLCLLLDSYTTALHALDAEVYCVRMRRDELAVAKSLRDMIDGGHEDRWLPIVRHHAALLDEALQHTRNGCLDVSFEDLTTQPRVTVKAVLDRFPFLDSESLDDAVDFVDGSLRHH